MSVIAACPESSRYVNDLLLIALAQNGALRLQCECALVSLIYDGSPCVTAEAGQSTLLCNPYDRSASVYQTLQQAFLDRIQSLAFFRGRRPAEQSDNVIANHTRHIVRNLDLPDSQRDHVASEMNPTQVSYAAVPIKSASGQILGIYSVVDSRIRDDFFGHETYTILNDIASATLRHLESQHIQLGRDHDRTANLNLSKFLEHNRPQPRAVRSLYESRHLSNSPTEPSRDSSSPANSFSSSSTLLDTSVDEAGFSADSSPLTTPPEEFSGFGFDKTPPSRSTTPCSLEKGLLAEAPETPTAADSQSPKRALPIAASLIRVAHDLEGLVLLDATSGSDYNVSRPNQDANIEHPSMCEQLEFSMGEEGYTPARITSFMSVEHKSLDYLISTFPQGCVMQVGDEGVLALVISDASRSGPALYQKLNEAIVLPQEVDLLLHQVRSLIFMPLWDSARQSFQVGMLGWAVDPVRVFTEHDLLSLSIYGRILTAEITRLDAIDTEATKSDFVSSLSHELRSPLHGCLAAVEILCDTALEKSQTELLEMIESCASTLLYTMNHLLDFSQINDLDRTQSKNRRSSHGDPSRNIFGQTVEDHLCRLVQEVVDSVSFGHNREQAAHELQSGNGPRYHTMSIDSDASSVTRNTDVAIFLDMECHTSWYSVIPAGAWKRLVMNLFGNSLKFCQRGHIEIVLKMVPDPKDPEKRVAHLMISDTGIGMSEKFLKQSLYRPFVQANSLISGNGLGLNIVKQIVHDLQGTISVKSTLGVGTQFDILVPMNERRPEPDEVLLDGGELLDPEGLLTGRTICLLSSPHTASETTDPSMQRSRMVHSYVRSFAESWFHMKVVTAEMTEKVDADIYVAEVSDYGMYCSSARQGLRTVSRHGTILIGNQRQMRQARQQCPHDFIEMNYPLGPQTLFRALFAALDMPTTQVSQTVMTPASARSIQQVEDYMNVSHVGQEPEDISNQPNIPSCPVNRKQAEHLLLVDDNAINLKLLSAYIQKLSLEAHRAIDGEDAFEIYKAFSSTHPFTTILMDISMPKMNGFESSRAIRDFEAEHGLPPARIIALTALGSEASKREAEASGIDEFQMKPVALKTLRGLLQSTSS